MTLATRNGAPTTSEAPPTTFNAAWLDNQRHARQTRTPDNVKASAQQPPRHVHDCDTCTYLGRFEECDLYFHDGGTRPALTTVIARMSSEPSDYTSGLVFSRWYPNAILGTDMPGNPALVEARRRAIARGYGPAIERADPTPKVDTGPLEDIHGAIAGAADAFHGPLGHEEAPCANTYGGCAPECGPDNRCRPASDMDYGGTMNIRVMGAPGPELHYPGELTVTGTMEVYFADPEMLESYRIAEENLQSQLRYVTETTVGTTPGVTGNLLRTGAGFAPLALALGAILPEATRRVRPACCTLKLSARYGPARYEFGRADPIRDVVGVQVELCEWPAGSDIERDAPQVAHWGPLTRLAPTLKRRGITLSGVVRNLFEAGALPGLIAMTVQDWCAAQEVDMEAMA